MMMAVKTWANDVILQADWQFIEAHFFFPGEGSMLPSIAGIVKSCEISIMGVLITSISLFRN